MICRLLVDFGSALRSDHDSLRQNVDWASFSLNVIFHYCRFIYAPVGVTGVYNDKIRVYTILNCRISRYYMNRYSEI